MSSRRSVRALAITALTALGITAFATPARAADNTVNVTGFWEAQGSDYLGGESSISPDAISGSSFTVVIDATGIQNDTVSVSPQSEGIVSNEQGDDCYQNEPNCKNKSLSNVLQTFTVQASVISFTGVFLVEDGTGRKLEGNGGDQTQTFSVRSTSSPSPDPDPEPTNAGSGSTPGAHIQQFRMPTTGTCDDAAPEGLDWGGAASGGWGPSWSQWANDGDGGNVCTRTLAYNTSTGSWQVQ